MLAMAAIRTLPAACAGALALALCLSAAAAPPAKPRIVDTIHGDFDGDHKRDSAWMEGYAGGRWKVVARLSSRPQPVVVDQGGGGWEGLYIAVDPPGAYKPACASRDPRKCPKPVRVTTDSVDISGEDGPSRVNYWDGARFKTFEQASDEGE
jgi:hypothetical protein